MTLVNKSFTIGLWTTVMTLNHYWQSIDEGLSYNSLWFSNYRINLPRPFAESLRISAGSSRLMLSQRLRWLLGHSEYSEYSPRWLSSRKFPLLSLSPANASRGSLNRKPRGYVENGKVRKTLYTFYLSGFAQFVAAKKLLLATAESLICGVHIIVFRLELHHRRTFQQHAEYRYWHPYATDHTVAEHRVDSTAVLW